jgi:arabinofuranosyltransferase
LIGLLALLALTIARTAWVGDDAYITFRTIDNLLNGYGMRWNVNERVQTYTHPLWFFVLTPAVALFGNPFVAALVMSALTSAVAVAFILRQAWARPSCVVFLLVALVCSKAFTDYSTSGLENTLSHAILAALMWWGCTPADTPRRAAIAGVLVALAALTRLDLILLAGPIGLAWLRHPRRTLPAFLLGLAPLVVWEIFSVIYYGVPFPNTAYAKLATGIGGDELLRQGLAYLLDSLERDPITLFVTACGVGAALGWGRGLRLVALAVLLYLVYVARIGGDFMSGRFFSAPFVVSLCLIARMPGPLTVPGRLAPVAAALAFGLSVPTPTIVSGAAYTTPWNEMFSPSGIMDERGLYFPVQGWLSTGGPRVTSAETPRLLDKIRAVKDANPGAFFHDTVGLAGYLTGPEWQMLDVLGLGDPLFARLPAKRPWRIGHFVRDVPDGYYETVTTGRNQIADPQIAALYEVIREVTQGPIWSARRWRAIVALNTGRTDDWPVSR